MRKLCVLTRGAFGREDGGASASCAMRGQHPLQERPPTMHFCINCGLREFPPSPLRVCNLLEGLSALTEAGLLEGTGDYTERMRIKTSRGKNHMGQTLGKELTWCFFCPVLTQSVRAPLLGSTCDSTPGVLPARAAHPSLGVQRGLHSVGVLD